MGSLGEMIMFEYDLIFIAMVAPILVGMSYIILYKDTKKKAKKPTGNVSNIAFHKRTDFMTSQQRIA